MSLHWALRFLTDLCAVHYPDNKGKELAVVYHLHNLKENVRIRYKVFTDIALLTFSAHTLYFLQPIGWKEKPMIFMG